MYLLMIQPWQGPLHSMTRRLRLPPAPQKLPHIPGLNRQARLPAIAELPCLPDLRQTRHPGPMMPLLPLLFRGLTWGQYLPVQIHRMHQVQVVMRPAPANNPELMTGLKVEILLCLAPSRVR